MQKRANTGRTEGESNKVAANSVVTKLGTVRQLTGRTWQGEKDDGSQTKDNDRYQT
jgi:hypothetical protein